MENIVLGQIVAPHGVRGDLRIMPLTANVQLFYELDYLLLPDGRRLHIVNARPHKNLILTRVKEVSSIEAVSYTHLDVYKRQAGCTGEGV